ncbi:MAG: signal peptidase I [Ruminococcus sp.]
MKKFFDIYRNILLIAAIIMLAIIVIPKLCGISPDIVLSSSMEPEIHVGSLCYINTHTEVSDITIGDTIAFATGNKKVVHRVVDIDPENLTITTKGDANEHEDMPISFDNYRGKVIFSIPKLGYFIKWIQSKTGIIAIATLFLISLASSIIYRDDPEKNVDVTEIKESDDISSEEPN